MFVITLQLQHEHSWLNHHDHCRGSLWTVTSLGVTLPMASTLGASMVQAELPLPAQIANQSGNRLVVFISTWRVLSTNPWSDLRQILSNDSACQFTEKLWLSAAMKVPPHTHTDTHRHTSWQTNPSICRGSVIPSKDLFKVEIRKNAISECFGPFLGLDHSQSSEK